MLQRSNLIANISPSLLEAAGLSNIDPSSLSVSIPDPSGFALEGDILGAQILKSLLLSDITQYIPQGSDFSKFLIGGEGELELFFDPAKKRRLQGFATAKSRDFAGSKTGGSRSLGSTLGKKGSGGARDRDLLSSLPGGEPGRPRSAGGGAESLSYSSSQGPSRVGTGFVGSRGSTAKSVELPRLDSSGGGGRGGEHGGVWGGGGAVKFVPELQSGVKLPEIR